MIVVFVLRGNLSPDVPAVIEELKKPATLKRIDGILIEDNNKIVIQVTQKLQMIKQQSQQAEKLSLQPEEIFKSSRTKKLVVKIVEDGSSIKNILQVSNIYQSNTIQEQNAKPSKDLEVSPEKQWLQKITNGTNIIIKLHTVKKGDQNLQSKLAQTMIRLELNEDPVILDIEFTIDYVAIVFEVDLDKAALQQRFKAAPEDLKQFARKIPIVLDYNPRKKQDDLNNLNNTKPPLMLSFHVEKSSAAIQFSTNFVATVFKLKVYAQKELFPYSEPILKQEIVVNL